MDVRFRTEPLGAEDESKFLVLELSGTLPIVSLSNAEIAYWANRCRNIIDAFQANGDRFVAVVLDMTCLHYRFGDAIGSLWILFMLRKIRPYIVATGDTRTCLESLITHSVPVDIVDKREDAYRMVRGS